MHVHAFSGSATEVVLLELVFSTEPELARGRKVGCGVLAQGVSRSYWPWGVVAPWAFLALGTDVKMDGLEGKGPYPACSCICLAARIDQELCLGKMTHCWLPHHNAWEWAEARAASARKCERPLILTRCCTHCRGYLSSCPLVAQE